MEKREHAAGRPRAHTHAQDGQAEAALGRGALDDAVETDGAKDARRGSPRTTHTTASGSDGQVRSVARSDRAPAMASAVAPAVAPASANAAQPKDAALALDPRRPDVWARLQIRHPGGAYEVSEADLVRAIRIWGAHGEQGVVRQLSEVLVRRCMPEFQRRSWGLRHRPELMEDAIAAMIEQLLREAQDPREQFMTLNFIHYLHCLCADNFGRVLRAEGLSYRRDAQGRPVGRPLHVPSALVDRLDVERDERDEEGSPAREVAAQDDPLGARMAALEAERILAFLPDPLDRKIMVLRALEHQRWDDIAAICGKTERTMRLRYEKARALLRERLGAEVPIS